MAGRKQDILKDLAMLKSRKAEVERLLEQSVTSLSVQIEKSDGEVQELTTKLAAAQSKHEFLLAQARRYVKSTTSAFDVGSLNELPQRARRARSTRGRTDLAGHSLDLNDAREQISHRFLSGGLVLGNLQQKTVERLDGKEWGDVAFAEMGIRTSGELIDALWQTPDGKGFYTALQENNVKLNPLAIYLNKGKGRLVPSSVTRLRAMV